MSVPHDLGEHRQAAYQAAARRTRWRLWYMLLLLLCVPPIWMWTERAEALFGRALVPLAIILWIPPLVLGYLMQKRLDRAIPTCLREYTVCSRCGSDLTGDVSDLCPECGTKVTTR